MFQHRHLLASDTDRLIPCRRWWRWQWTKLWRCPSGSCGSPGVKGQETEAESPITCEFIRPELRVKTCLPNQPTRQWWWGRTVRWPDLRTLTAFLGNTDSVRHDSSEQAAQHPAGSLMRACCDNYTTPQQLQLIVSHNDPPPPALCATVTSWTN